MIWLIGEKGMLGREVAARLNKNGRVWCGSDREVDITDSSALELFAKDKPLSWIINCSAYTAVDRAEEEAETAYLINSTGVRNLVELALKRDIPLIHISTDYVFNGQQSTPYSEEQTVDPQGIYGKSKAAGEKAIIDSRGKFYVIRTSWLYGKYGPNFVKTMIRLHEERETLGVVDDQIGSPTWAGDLSMIILALLRKPDGPWGIYHYSNEGSCSWYEFACEIFRQAEEKGLINHHCLVNPLKSSEVPAKAPRPAYSLLSKEKVKAFLGINIPGWKESLRIYLADYVSD